MSDKDTIFNLFGDTRDLTSEENDIYNDWLDMQSKQISTGINLDSPEPCGTYIHKDQTAYYEFDVEHPIFGHPYGSYKCSNCGKHSEYKYQYCHWCGKFMTDYDKELDDD